MALTPTQREELDRLGPEVVRQKFNDAGVSVGSGIGLKCGTAGRLDVEDWLAEQYRKATKLQADI